MNFFRQDAASLQNSALCSILLWRFCFGYEDSSGGNRLPQLQLLFTILPITLNPFSRTVLQSTQVDRGLIAFAAKFATPPVRVATASIDGVALRRGRENFLALNDRMLAFRPLTIRALAMAVAKNLVRLDPGCGEVGVLSHARPPTGESAELKEMFRTAEKLGTMCAPHSLSDVSRILGVGF